jgi:catechol 2,3-dioxygenase-like lactoylglutathione lyase family enzyme
VKIKAVVETAIYVDDLQAAETFYGTVLGLRVMGKEPGPCGASSHQAHPAGAVRRTNGSFPARIPPERLLSVGQLGVVLFSSKARSIQSS